MEHKYKNIVQVGDEVKYKNGEAYYIVMKISKCGEKCELHHTSNNKTYMDAWIKSLTVVSKNPNILSHKEIKEKTLSKSYYEKTNPHKKVGMKVKATPKQLDYLVTQYAPLVSINSKAGENDNVYSRKVITGEKALSDYIIELDKEPVRYLTDVRILGRTVKIDIKREVTIK